MQAKKGILLTTFLCITALIYGQNSTISGYVRDSENGEELIGVTVYHEDSGKGVVTNLYGFYSLTLPNGNINLKFSYVGYESFLKTIELQENLSLNINLSPEVKQLDDLVITAKKEDENVTEVAMSKNEINITQVKRLPALFGEPDLIKTVQMMPGVVTAGEGTSAFFVRGGSADQNLILIDEAPIYDPSHLFGLFSVFNADVIKDSELYKGGIPSRYGGRLSSILDVRSIDGNNQNFGGNVSIGPIAAKAMIEGPIVKDKSSFLLSGRRSFSDIFLNATGQDASVFFYDVNAKVNIRHNNKNRFFASAYLGRDFFNFDDLFSFGWGNKTATFRWNHLFSDKLFSNTTIIASNFDYELGLDDEAQGFDWLSDIREYTAKQDFEWFINPDNRLEFGFMSTFRRFSPGTIQSGNEDSFLEGIALDLLYGIDNNVYIEAENNLKDKLTLRYGLRVSMFQNVGPGDVYVYEDPQDNIDINRIDTLSYKAGETIAFYPNLEPRFAARYMLNKNSSIKLSYNRMFQNTHLLASGTIPLPFNTWQPSSYYLKPQRADQVAGGYFKNMRGNSLSFSAEAYYKFIDNVTDFADNAQLFFNEDLPTEFRQGTSESYGTEWMLEKTKGQLTGMVSYTWSKTFRTIPGVNQGNPFAANFDRRHSFNMMATYEHNEQWIFGSAFTYGSGRPLTIPTGVYEIEDRYRVNYYSERNGYRLPAFHRLDLSGTFYPRKNETREWKSKWVFSIYNVYNRKNPFTIFIQEAQNAEGEPTGQQEARMIYLFSIIPSFTYSIEF